MIPNYLRHHVALYQSDPRASAVEWFRNAGFGMFLHYGLYTLLGRHEWAKIMERIPVAEYGKLGERFTAERFDAGAIASLAEEGGCRYINLTTRHHESFCLWDTRTADFNSVRAPRCGRDLLTLRNGTAGSDRYPKGNAEKLILDPPDQRAPAHF